MACMREPSFRRIMDLNCRAAGLRAVQVVRAAGVVVVVVGKGGRRCWRRLSRRRWQNKSDGHWHLSGRVETDHETPPKQMPARSLLLARTVKTDALGNVTCDLPDAGWWCLTISRANNLDRDGTACAVAAAFHVLGPCRRETAPLILHDDAPIACQLVSAFRRAYRPGDARRSGVGRVRRGRPPDAMGCAARRR